MTNHEPELPPTGLVAMAAIINGSAQAIRHAQETARRQQEDDRQRRTFLDEAHVRGLTTEDAERILTVAHSDNARQAGIGNPYDFAHALLRIVVTP